MIIMFHYIETHSGSKHILKYVILMFRKFDQIMIKDTKRKFGHESRLLECHVFSTKIQFRVQTMINV